MIDESSKEFIEQRDTAQAVSLECLDMCVKYIHSQDLGNSEKMATEGLLLVKLFRHMISMLKETDEMPDFLNGIISSFKMFVEIEKISRN